MDCSTLQSQAPLSPCPITVARPLTPWMTNAAADSRVCTSGSIETRAVPIDTESGSHIFGMCRTAHDALLLWIHLLVVPSCLFSIASSGGENALGSGTVAFLFLSGELKQPPMRGNVRVQHLLVEFGGRVEGERRALLRRKLSPGCYGDLLLGAENIRAGASVRPFPNTHNCRRFSQSVQG